MKSVVTFFLVMFVLEGVGIMALSVPFILGRVKPNRFSGFRVPATLNDEGTWYRVNAKFGRWFFGTGAVFALAATLLYFVPGVGDDIAAYTLLCTAVFFVAFGVAIGVSCKEINR